MTFSREDQRQRVEARVSDDLAERVDEFATQHDLSKSDVLRQALRDYLPDDAAALPSDPQLRDAYQWLRERTDHRGTISGSAAVNGLAQALSMNKKFVKRSRLKPLDKAGWITADRGRIYVHDPTRTTDTTETEPTTEPDDEDPREEARTTFDALANAEPGRHLNADD